MDDDGGYNLRHWGFFEPPPPPPPKESLGYYEQPKENLGLQLNVGRERDSKPRFLQLPEPSVHGDYNWMHQRHQHHHSNGDTSKIHHVLPSHHGYSSYDTSDPHTLQMLHLPIPPKEEKVVIPQVDDSNDHNNDVPMKKRSQGRSVKPPKQKRPKKVNNSNVQERNGLDNGSVSKVKAVKKSTAMVINGIDFDLSEIPTPVCSCTGNRQQCYRWGVGGWQSACCTTSISMYPLPMSTKRRGARIAGRKMSQGAFKKVLEKLAGEGYNLEEPIDLRTYWAKHGTNKFVTIRS